MKTVVVVVLSAVMLGLTEAQFSLPSRPSARACSFSQAQDSVTLMGRSFVENVGANKCFTSQSAGPKNKPISLDTCSWNSFPRGEQLFFFRNNGGGLTLKPTVTGFGSPDLCLAPNNQMLSTVQCMPKARDQMWQFKPVRMGPLGGTLYQIVQGSTGLCLKASSSSFGSNIVGTRCNVLGLDNLQLWRICSSK